MALQFRWTWRKDPFPVVCIFCFPCPLVQGELCNPVIWQVPLGAALGSQGCRPQKALVQSRSDHAHTTKRFLCSKSVPCTEPKSPPGLMT